MSSCLEKMDQSLFATKICKLSKGYLHMLQAIHFWKNYYPHRLSDLQVPSILVLLRPTTPCKCFPHTSQIKIGKSKKFGMLRVFRTLYFGYCSYKSPGCTFFIHFYRINKNRKADCPCRPSKMLQNAAYFLEICIWILSLLIIAFLYSWYVNHDSNIFYVNFQPTILVDCHK